MASCPKCGRTKLRKQTCPRCGPKTGAYYHMKREDYNRGMDQAKEVPWGRIILWGFIGLGGLIVAGLIGNVAGVFSSVATAPGRVIQKALETDNIIHNYEWFHDYHAAYQAKMGQIRDHSGLVDGSSGSEKSRLAIELAAIRQTCRELVTRYNANSTKTNRSIFKGRTAPAELEILTCDL